MTIKQSGGVFGRNPEFNTVTANSADINGGTIKLDGNYPVGTNNVALGNAALDSNVSGASNTAIGADALTANTASNNTAVGHQAGFFITTGSKNTILGRYNGNQDGLDIRAASNYIVLSDGDGNARAYHNGTNWTVSGGIHIGGTGSANLLDDYEEGTWTALIISGGGSITTDADYETLAYKKIGSVVHVFGYTQASSVASPTGFLTISGLPFTAGAGGADLAQMSASVWLNGLATTVAHPVARVSGSNIDIFDYTGTGVTNNVAAAFQASTAIYLSATYSV